MEWMRTPWMRTIAAVAALALIVGYWQDRGVLFWLAVAALILNVLGFAATRDTARQPERPRPGPDAEVEEHRLSDLLHVPGVADAFAAGPPQWRQVSHLEETFGPVAVGELAEFMWVGYDDGWTVAVEDEVKPYVDLDVDEADDPVLSVLEAHPSVESAWHEDREVYRVEQRRPIALEEFAALAARALVAHHGDAVSRLSGAG